MVKRAFGATTATSSREGGVGGVGSHGDVTGPDGLWVSVIECWNVFLRASVARSIRRFPRELICISGISPLANCDVSNRLQQTDVGVCGRGQRSPAAARR